MALVVAMLALHLSACSEEPVPFFFGEGPDGLTCSDGLDNDADGLTDCDDPGCAGSEACGGPGPDIGDVDVRDADAGGDDIGTDSAPGDVATPDADVESEADADAESEPDADAVDDAVLPPGPLERAVAADVCERWRLDRADLREGTWSGETAACSPGELDQLGRDNTLRQVNLMRWLAWLDDDVEEDASRRSGAQACALISHANGGLSHNPPPSSRCYSADGAREAGASNLSPTPGVEAIDLYMSDPGNETTLGHRRWILSDSLETVGLGSTSGYSCLGVIGGFASGSSDWTAWPAPGPFPIQAINVSWSSVDDNGWSLQSDRLNLGRAEITVLEDGVERPVRVTSLLGGYGSAYAISIIPDGWRSRAGSTYTVEVGGVASPFSYEIDMIDCS